jgi:choline dehydrogenase-like flavoprotein
MKMRERTSSIPSPQKSTPEEYDVVILGGGNGSAISAWTFAGQGKRVAVPVRSLQSQWTQLIALRQWFQMTLWRKSSPE